MRWRERRADPGLARGVQDIAPGGAVEADAPSSSGAAAVALEAGGCAAVTVGDETMSLDLPAGGEWLLMHLALLYEAREAVMVVKLGSGSWLSIGLEMRSGLERSVAEGALA